MAVALAVGVAGCGGARAGGASGWEKAPPPEEEQRISGAVLTELAAEAVAGFEPMGASRGRELKRGELFTHRFAWRAGRCHAAVAGGLGGVRALEVWLIAWGPKVWPPKVVAHGRGAGAVAIAGGGDRCFVADVGLDGGALVVRVDDGAGFAAAQLYAR